MEDPRLLTAQRPSRLQASIDVKSLRDRIPVHLRNVNDNTLEGSQSLGLGITQKQSGKNATVNRNCMGNGAEDEDLELEESQVEGIHLQHIPHGSLSYGQMPHIHSQEFPSLAASHKEVPIVPNSDPNVPPCRSGHFLLSPMQAPNSMQDQSIQDFASHRPTGQQQCGLGQEMQTLVPQGMPSITRKSVINPSAYIQKAPMSVFHHRSHLPYRTNKVSRCIRTASAQPAVPALLRRCMDSSAPTAKTFSSLTPRSWTFHDHSGDHGHEFMEKRQNTDEIIFRPAPKPTEAYLTNAGVPPTRVSSPQTLLIVLDLNGTILYRTPKKQDLVRRPGLRRFLNYCFDVHRVLVWSSAEPHNLAVLCQKVFTAAQHELLLGQWSRERFGLTPELYKQRVQVYKDLNTVWNDPGLQSRHPDSATGGMWGQHNTVLIDDSAVKAAAQPFNHIEVPEFVTMKGVDVIEETILTTVVKMLEEARIWSDISAFVRSKRDEGALHD